MSASQMQHALAVNALFTPMQSKSIHMNLNKKVASANSMTTVANAKRFFSSSSSAESASDSEGYSSFEEEINKSMS